MEDRFIIKKGSFVFSAPIDSLDDIKLYSKHIFETLELKEMLVSGLCWNRVFKG